MVRFLAHNVVNTGYNGVNTGHNVVGHNPLHLLREFMVTMVTKTFIGLQPDEFASNSQLNIGLQPDDFLSHFT